MLLSKPCKAALGGGLLLGLAIAAGPAGATEAEPVVVGVAPMVPLADAVLDRVTPIDIENVAPSTVDRVSLIRSTSMDVVSEPALKRMTLDSPALDPSAVVAGLGVAGEAAARRQDRVLILRQSGRSTQALDEGEQGTSSRITQSSALVLSPKAVDPQLGVIMQSGALDGPALGPSPGTSQSAANVRFTVSTGFRP